MSGITTSDSLLRFSGYRSSNFEKTISYQKKITLSNGYVLMVKTVNYRGSNPSGGRDFPTRPDQSLGPYGPL